MSLSLTDFHLVYYTFALPNGESERVLALPEVSLLHAGAQEMGITLNILPNSEITRFQLGDHVEHVFRATPTNTTVFAHRACAQKESTKSLLQQAGIQTARGHLLSSQSSLQQRRAVYESLQKPLVVKQNAGMHGSQVYVGRDTPEAYAQALESVFAHLKNRQEKEFALVEEQFSGQEYRILATPEKVVAIMHREPANVVGDGVASVAELIDQKNQDPLRNIHAWLYPHLAADSAMAEFLARQGLSFSFVPSLGQKVVLRGQSNIMSGGDPVDVTDTAHPSVKEIALRAIRAIPGLSYAGIDFMTRDITQAQTADSHIIVEVNSLPGFAMHDLPMRGVARGATTEFLLLLFPELRNA